MFKGFYTVATGMIAQQRKTEIISNNMANANTPGFKSDQTTIRSFPDMLMSATNTTKIPTQKGFTTKNLETVGAVNTGVYLQETLANHTQGSLRETGLATDIALMDGNMPIDETSGNSGAVFFKLQGEDGQERYTRNGNFTRDGQGNLVNPQGLYVLSDAGQKIQLDNDQFTVTNEGQIIDANGATVATLGISFSANPDTLIKLDNGLYQTIDDANLPSAYNQQGVNFAMQQNYLEGSNVDASKSMTELMTAYRAFEANQKVLQAYDKSMDKAANEIGKV